LQLVKKKKKEFFYYRNFQMIVFAWYPINYYKLSLGKQDQLSIYIKDLKHHYFQLNDSIKGKMNYFHFLNRNGHIIIKNILNKLTKGMFLFCFIRPWFDETTGLKM
jgi:hypothetical protein